jgi:hypothetical protein
MTTNYVRGASITSAASRVEIQDMLTDYGATGFRCGWEEGRAAIAFTAGERRFRFVLALPGSADLAGSVGDRLQPRRQGTGTKSAEEQARWCWHRLSLLIRAKLEAVASGIVSFDQEFLAYMVLPGGDTVFQDAAPAIGTAYATGVHTGLLRQDGRQPGPGPEVP